MTALITTDFEEYLCIVCFCRQSAQHGLSNFKHSLWIRKIWYTNQSPHTPFALNGGEPFGTQEKKRQMDAQREKEIAEQEVKNQFLPRAVEDRAFKTLLAQQRLAIHEVGIHRHTLDALIHSVCRVDVWHWQCGLVLPHAWPRERHARLLRG